MTTTTEYTTLDEILKVQNVFLNRTVEYIHVFIVEVSWFGEEGLAKRKEH